MKLISPACLMLFLSACSTHVSRDLHVSSLAVVLNSQITSFIKANDNSKCDIWPSLHFSSEYLKSALGTLYESEFFENELMCGKNIQCSEQLKVGADIQKRFLDLRKPVCSL